MLPIGSLLWRNLRVFQIYGSNTDVGKTVIASILCNATKTIWNDEHTTYLKPVSTGPQREADHIHIARYTSDVSYRNLFQYGEPVSPHIAAKGNVVSDDELFAGVHQYASKKAAAGPGWLFIETAGGIHSPSPSGTPQADLYAPMRCPVVLVGDWKLGGISSTISAFEGLKIRGYDVESIVLFEKARYGNSNYLKAYFKDQHDIPVTALPMPPMKITKKKDRDAMHEYYAHASKTYAVKETLTHLDHRHVSRIQALENSAADAHQKIWYPFTQQKLIQPKDILPIDSAYGNYFQTLMPPKPLPPKSPKSPESTESSESPESPETTTPSVEPLLQSSFDGSASWWTQGLGHGNTSLTLAAAYAAGRYGHVMFAGMVHKPALDLATSMLEITQNPRLSRVFFSDNGSTGMEVAVKMALRAARTRYGWPADAKIDILGLKGSYHGDTIGTMDCSEPNTYNEKVEWYEGKGVWLDYPQVQCVAGEWEVQVPPELGAAESNPHRFSNLSEIFELEQRIARGEHKNYETYILSTLRQYLGLGRRFGALILEPVVLGAGGMRLVDPLFQKTLVDMVRNNASLFGSVIASGPQSQVSDNSSTDSRDDKVWSGLPVVFDEVFTGLYRLGRPMAASFLDTNPDISVHAKLMTGGLVPLCVTLASECIFDAFASEEKSDALLHGHSYTAHPVGCQVALESLKQLKAMDKTGGWDWAKSDGWSQADTGVEVDSVAPQTTSPLVWSIWPLTFVHDISLHTSKVAGIWALGSVLAINLRASDGSGYTSTAAEGLRQRLLAGIKTISTIKIDRNDKASIGETPKPPKTENPHETDKPDKTDPIGSWNVHSRVLGNVLYIMGSQRMTKSEVEELCNLIRKSLMRCDRSGL